MKPVVDGLIKKHSGHYDIRVMNTAKREPRMMSLARKYAIKYVPTFVFVRGNGSVNASVVGAVSASRLEKELAKLG